ncbi:MAG TPA: ATP-binding protein [Solirubrobacteraceae bacterium]|nr:ATP-binding protein [Solirubrobacteraceae bacterium]
MELSLPARAENIALIRHAFGALGETFAVDEELLSDVRLAVTEACSNVVVHAYAEEAPGPLEVLATLDDGTLTVVVRDEGPGIAPHPDSPGLGLGLPLIASLAESVHLGRDEHERTEVRMTFSLSNGQVDGAWSTPPAGGVASAADPDDPDDQTDPATRT